MKKNAVVDILNIVNYTNISNKVKNYYDSNNSKEQFILNKTINKMDDIEKTEYILFKITVAFIDTLKK